MSEAYDRVLANVATARESCEISSLALRVGESSGSAADGVSVHSATRFVEQEGVVDGGDVVDA